MYDLNNEHQPHAEVTKWTFVTLWHPPEHCEHYIGVSKICNTKYLGKLCFEEIQSVTKSWQIFMHQALYWYHYTKSNCQISCNSVQPEQGL